MRTLNLGILAHVDAGKTSLTERLLYAAGVIDEIGSVDDGSTQTDTIKKPMSVAVLFGLPNPQSNRVASMTGNEDVIFYPGWTPYLVPVLTDEFSIRATVLIDLRVSRRPSVPPAPARPGWPTRCCPPP